MSETVAFDTTAWWEVLHATDTGKMLAQRYVHRRGAKVVTLDLVLAELSGRLARAARRQDIGLFLRSVEAKSEVDPITRDVAAKAGPLLVHLRTVKDSASLADALMLANARRRGIRLVSDDGAFAKERDVVWPG